jgi:hypothetical protein
VTTNVEPIPSPKPDQVLEAIRAGIGEAGTLASATTVFAAMRDAGTQAGVGALRRSE